MSVNQCICSRCVPILVFAAFLMQGCATNLTKPKGPPQPPATKFGEFEHVEMKKVSLAQPFSEHVSNQKAQTKINEIMFQQVAEIFPQVKEYDDKPGSPEGAALVIEPNIKEIKFIGGAARFWAGALAGSSAVLMQVTFIDEATGDVLSAPEFYQQASAMGGAWSFGGSDNGMLHRICTEVTKYMSAHKE